MTDDLIGVDAADLQRQLEYAARLENTIVDLEAERDRLSVNAVSERAIADAWRGELETTRLALGVAGAERDELREETTVLRQRLSEAGSTVLELEEERDRYRAALEQAKPIVDAACRAVDYGRRRMFPVFAGMVGMAIVDAVDEYRALNGGTDD